MQLPPLNAVRAFAAASRHQHFKDAADALGVTPGAIGRQIKLLEDYLGTTLFERDRVAVRLTPAGAEYASQILESLRLIEAATKIVSRRGRRRPLRVWCSRTFMRQWLVPRLASYREQYPGCEMTFTTSDGIRDIDGSSVDIAIRLGDGKWGNAEVHHLFDNYLIPVCSPTYAAKFGEPRDPRELLEHTLLHSLRRRNDWDTWMVAAGLEPRPISNSIGFEGDSLAYQAALEGLGIALARKGFYEFDMRAGRILPLLGIEAKAPGSFYLVHETAHAFPAHVRRFREWILSEVTSLRPA